MEDTLRATNNAPDKELDVSLNPCFNGRYSQSIKCWSIISVRKS